MKYMGSKNKIARQLLDVMLPEMDDRSAFVDAFCGGCNLIDKVPAKYRRIANDKNRFLVAMFKRLQSGGSFPTKFDKKIYDYWRQEWHNNKRKPESESEMHDALIGWVGFMGSNNGRFYDGGWAGNSKNGRDYVGEAMRNVLKQAPSLSGIEFYSTDYAELEIPNNSLVYCDIPYKNTVPYTTGAFDYSKFYQWCKDMTAEGHKVYVSEMSMPEGFEMVWEKPHERYAKWDEAINVKERLFLCK